MTESKLQHWKEVGQIFLCFISAVVFVLALQHVAHTRESAPVTSVSDHVSGYDGRPQLRGEGRK